MRRAVVTGNWKMNTNKEEALSLTNSIIANTEDIINVDIVIAPPFLGITSLAKILNQTKIRLCAQNCSHERNGAHTGEVSASMLRHAGVSHVILGHSERRENLGESDELIAKKLSSSIEEVV